MEYRRRRNTKRSNTASGGKIVIILLVLIAAVYFVSVSAVGSWLSKHIVEPVFSAFTSKESESESDDDTESMYTVNTQSSESFPGLSCYLLQMGVFSEKERAEVLASELKSQGAAGYVYEDGDRYRVFASGYASESDARSVKERLQGEGKDCSVYKLSVPEAKYDVSVTAGTDSTMTSIESAFYAVLSAHDDLLTLEQNFAAGNMTAKEGANAALDIHDELKKAVTNKESLPDEISACIYECEKALSDLAGSESASESEFLSKIRYTQIAVAVAFTDTVAKLTV
ncbi:MAG: SPOR domain-containing protein [Clostridia bacterium]|nr:SPOR domain-containing protein [Clostridia bacterium]